MEGAEGETDDLGMDPVGISSEFSCMRTFCQSENFDCSMLSDQNVLFAHVGFWHMIGWSQPECSNERVSSVLLQRRVKKMD